MEFINPTKKGYTIYSKSGCPYCDKAKKLLEDDNLTVVDCDSYLTSSKDEFLKFIANLSKKEQKMFPIIFKDAQIIGGYSDLLGYLKEDWSKN